VEAVEVLRAGWAGDCEFEVWTRREGCCVGVEGRAHGGEEGDEVSSLGVVLGVFPVNVDAVKAQVLDEIDAGASKGVATGRSRCGALEVG
jgi:hypothetical protein